MTSKTDVIFRHDDDGSLVIRARLPAEEGAVVLQALNAAMDAQCTEEHEDVVDDVTAVTPVNESRFAQRRADALTMMAKNALRHGPGPLSSAERYQVVVHVTAETLAAGDAGRSELDSGQHLAPGWIIPASALDLDLSISGLIQSGERNTRAGPYVS